MSDIPEWFGKPEFYTIMATVWLYLISWILVNLIRVKGIKLDIKKRILGFKHWWVKRKEMKTL